jgi:hypothetical protein
MVLKTLEAITPPFPPGTIVKLSDNTMAVVVGIDQSSPYRPTVRRIVGDDLELGEQKLNLEAPDAPSITHVGREPVEHLFPEGNSKPSKDAHLTSLSSG